LIKRSIALYRKNEITIVFFNSFINNCLSFQIL
jgi:hypothetical protein